MIKAIEPLNSNGLVSIIIPVYNVAPYLNESLNSVIQQTYDNLEIIIIDDNSTDGSGAICDEYAEKDKRVHIIHHQVNKGLSSARNAGLDFMTGVMVAFLDSDDALHPDFIKMMINNIIYNNTDMALCKYNCQRTINNMRIENKAKKKKPIIRKGVYDKVSALQLLINGSINNHVWNKLYASELWQGIRFPDGHVYEDLDVTYRIVERCNRISVLDDILYMRRIRSGSITASWTQEKVNDWLLASSHFETFISDNIPCFFTEEHMKKFNYSWLKQMIVFYAIYSSKKSVKDREFSEYLKKHILKKVNNIKIDEQNLKVGYFMLCYFPWILKTNYKVYSFFKSFLL